MRIYSAEWVEAFNRAATPTASDAADPTDPTAEAGADADADGRGDFRLVQVVDGAPQGTVRIGLESTDGRVVMTLDPPPHPAPQVTLSLHYEDAEALSRGDIDPARLVATGRVKVRGDLSVLVAGQALLAEVAARVADLSGTP